MLLRPAHAPAPPFQGFRRADDLPVTEDLSQRIVGLPMANDIGLPALERIRDLVRGATRSSARPWSRSVEPAVEQEPPAATVA